MVRTRGGSSETVPGEEGRGGETESRQGGAEGWFYDYLNNF